MAPESKRKTITARAAAALAAAVALATPLAGLTDGVIPMARATGGPEKPKRVPFDQRVHTHSREKARRRRQMERAK